MALIASIFKLEKEIGRGAYATVYAGKTVAPYPPLNAGDLVAVKAIASSRVSSAAEQEKLNTEITLMKTLDHPNIIRLYGVEKRSSHSFLIMEYALGGDLLHYLRSRNNALPEDTIRDFGWQIGSGLRYLHEHQIIHRDLKPHNILLSGTDEHPILKIADFGFARFLRSTDLAETICGSPIYMAPEIQFGNKYSELVDMWSVGVMLYELITGTTPFSGLRSQHELAEALKLRGSQPYTLPVSAHVSQNVRDLITRLLTLSQDDRMTLEEYLDHPFFASMDRDKVDSVTSANEHEQTIYGEESGVRLRAHRFSFLMADGTADEQRAEQGLLEAIDSANVIDGHLSDCQKMGDFALFELLTILCEFLLDFTAESSLSPDHSCVEETVRMANGYAQEADEYAKQELKRGDSGAIDFLYEKGIEYAKAGAEAEKDGDPIGLLKYQRAMAMLRPIAYSTGSDKFTISVRELYIQISKRADLIRSTH